MTGSENSTRIQLVGDKETEDFYGRLETFFFFSKSVSKNMNKFIELNIPL